MHKITLYVRRKLHLAGLGKVSQKKTIEFLPGGKPGGGGGKRVGGHSP